MPEHIRLIIATSGAVACAGYLLIALVKFSLSVRANKLQSRSKGGSAESESDDAETNGQSDQPFIAIVQPILSGDPHLNEMIKRNVAQIKAPARFYWMVDAHDQVAQQVCEELSAGYPDRTETFVCEAAPEGENPKVYKLRLALERLNADTDDADRIDRGYYIVLDDDTCIGQSNLDAAINELERCDLATGLPSYETGAGLWTSLVAHFVNNNSIATYLPLLNFREPVSINGMFYVMRISTLRKHAPFDAIRKQVCDDYALAKFCRKTGLKIKQLTSAQRLRTHVDSAAHYRRLMHRWFVFANHLVFDQNFGTRLTLFFLLGLSPLLLWISLLSFFDWRTLLLLACALVVRHILIRTLHQIVFGFLPRFSWWRSLLAELLQPVHLLDAMVRPRIDWRGRAVRIGKDGTFANIS